VPRHKGGVGRLLDKEVGGPAQQIRALEVLDRVEDGAVPDKLGEPGKQQVRFMAQIALERPARPPLELFEPPAERRGLGLRHDADREDAALLPILFDLGRCQTFRHRSSQSSRPAGKADNYHSPHRTTTVDPPRFAGRFIYSAATTLRQLANVTPDRTRYPHPANAGARGSIEALRPGMAAISGNGRYR